MSCDNLSMPYSHINQSIKRDLLFPAQLKLSTVTLLNDVIDVRSSFYVTTPFITAVDHFTHDFCIIIQILCKFILIWCLRQQSNHHIFCIWNDSCAVFTCLETSNLMKRNGVIVKHMSHQNLKKMWKRAHDWLCYIPNIVSSIIDILYNTVQ